jgi:hypothetical protein
MSDNLKIEMPVQQVIQLNFRLLSGELKVPIQLSEVGHDLGWRSQ